MRDARSRLIELGQSGASEARLAAATTLEMLATIIEALDPRAGERSLADLRFQAERLRRADWFPRAGWIEQGLSSALDALESAKSCAGHRGVWIDAAREAIGEIDERTSLTFQRAPIQDAFRATVDAFGVHVASLSSCEDVGATGATARRARSGT